MCCYYFRKKNLFDDPLITDPVQDWPLFYFKDEESWPEKYRIQLKKQKNLYVVKEQHVWKRIGGSEGDKAEKLLKFIPVKRRADLVEDFHPGFGHQGDITVQQLMKSRFCGRA